MKRVICIIMIAAILAMCLTLTASAKCTIPDILQTKMSGMDESDTIRVILWVRPIGISDNEIHRQAMQNAGFSVFDFGKLNVEEMNRYILERRKIESSLEKQARDSFLKDFFIADSAINEVCCLNIDANLTKAQITAAAACDKITSIDYEDRSQQATELPAEVVPPYLYKARFAQKYADQYKENEWRYQELYYHKDENGETDWALVYAYLPMVAPLEFVTVVANRVLFPYNIYSPFDARYGIYDVRADSFIDAGSLEAKSYPDFVRVFDETVTEGRLIGDLDRDGTISVIDATIIQRCEANLRNYPEDDVFYLTYEWGNPRCYSDFDRDGERGITDTTAIQRYLANIG